MKERIGRVPGSETEPIDGEKEVNFHEVARERAALRGSLEDLGISSTAVLRDIREGIPPADRSLKDESALVRKLGEKIAKQLNTMLFTRTVNKTARAYVKMINPEPKKEKAES